MKIRRHKRHNVPTLNLASMPDLIFTVLFFFMIVTHMRTETPQLKVDEPKGTELSKPTSKRTITNLYIGTDSKGNTHIQIGNSIVPPEKVGDAIMEMRSKLAGEDMEMYTVNIKADKNTPMGVVTDVKQELRRVGALNIRYSALESQEKDQ